MKKTLICLLSVLLTICLFTSCSSSPNTVWKIEVEAKSNEVFKEDSIKKFITVYGYLGNGNKVEIKDYSTSLENDIVKEGTGVVKIYYDKFTAKIDLSNMAFLDIADYTMKGWEWTDNPFVVNKNQVTSINITKTKPSSITTEGVDLTCNGTGNIMGYISGTDIYIVGDYIYGNTNCEDVFSYFSSLNQITGLEYFDTSNVSNMSNMFRSCTSLTKLDLSIWETSKVTNMELLFYGCSSLSELIISSFDTSSVSEMNSMFYGCSSLTNLDLSSFDTSNVETMAGMFASCSALTSSSVKLTTKWSKTGKVIDGMFDSTGGLSGSDIFSNWN